MEQAIQGELLEILAIQRLLWIPGIGHIVAFWHGRFVEPKYRILDHLGREMRHNHV